MVVVRIRQERLVDDQRDIEAQSSRWKAAILLGDKCELVEVVNPFSKEQEKDVTWYMEEYVNNPYEISKATGIKSSLRDYATRLASAITFPKFFPRNGDLELEIESEVMKTEERSGQTSVIETSINTLHWETLEDPSIWPKVFSYKSITVRRTFQFSSPSKSSRNANEDSGVQLSTFNILLVISRPKGRQDIEYQLVSRRLVNALDQVHANTNIKVRLSVLRPPTWQEFSDHLLNQVLPGHYQLVHFDMHGKVTKTKSGEIRANLRFSRYVEEAQEIYETKGLLKSAQDIASVLIQAKVTCVIANACDSASTAHDSTAGNFADVLVRSGIHFVLAMSYQIIDNAVEMFMERFYSSLLVHGRDVGQSAHDGRQVLLNRSERPGRFLQNITLVDYFVPVCYQDASISPLRVLSSSGRSGSSAAPDRGTTRIMGRLIDRMRQSSPSPERFAPVRHSFSRLKEKVLRRPKDIPSLQEEILGRDYSILEMEHILKRCQKLLLYGQGGCGKTSLLKYCEWWWKKTAFIDDSYYFDFSTLLNTDGKFEDLLAGIGKILSSITPSEEAILDELRPRSVLLIFDSMETFNSPGLWQRARFPPEEQDKLWSFLKRACRGSTYVVFSSRVDTVPDADSVPSAIAYPLTGLTISASALLAEEIIHTKSPSDAVKFETRESVEYLRRIFILLEGNPEAIKAVLPNLWTSSLTTASLFELLLVGTCPLDPEISRNSRFLRSIRSVNAELELYAAFGSGPIAPWILFPFWNLMPRNLNTYLYFFYWKMGALLGPFAAERSYGYCFHEYFEADVGTTNIVFKTESALNRILDKLKGAGIIHEAQVTYKDTTVDTEVYHVHPLFTLCARNMVQEAMLHACIYAFYRHQSLWGKKSIGESSPEMTKLVWDKEIQHIDHLRNNQVAAILYSLDADILEEVELHSMSTTDILLVDVIDAFYHNRRLGELLKPILKKHLTRLITMPIRRGDNTFTRHEVTSILGNVYNVVKDSNENELKLIDIALRIGQDWKSDPSNVWPPELEQSWYELLLEHSKYTIGESYHKGKEELEKVLATNPATPSSDSLYGPIRRVYLQLLMGWIECASMLMGQEHGIDEKTMVVTGSKEFIKLFKIGDLGNFFDVAISTPEYEPFIHLALKDTLGVLVFPHFEADVAKFGSLTETIMDEPMWMNYKQTADETWKAHMERMTKPGTMNQSLASTTEYHFRSLAGEGESARGLINKVLDQQSSSSSSGPRDLAGLHEMLYFEAKEQGDWPKSLQHLEVIESLQRGLRVSSEDEARLHLRFANSYDELSQGEECARRVLEAYELLGSSPDEKEQSFFLRSVTQYGVLEGILAKKNKLGFSERRKLQEVITSAKEYTETVEKIDEMSEKLSLVVDKLTKKLEK